MKNLFFCITSIFILSLNGCILDSLNELPLNVPISVPVIISGDDDNVSGDFCLEESELFSDYQDKIKEVQLLEISFRPTELNPVTLKGDFQIIIQAPAPRGQLFYNKTFTDLTLSQYTPPHTPFVVPASSEEFAELNNFLSENNHCLSASVSLHNITPAGSRTVSGYLDLVFRTTTDLE